MTQYYICNKHSYSFTSERPCRYCSPITEDKHDLNSVKTTIINEETIIPARQGFTIKLNKDGNYEYIPNKSPAPSAQDTTLNKELDFISCDCKEFIHAIGCPKNDLINAKSTAPSFNKPTVEDILKMNREPFTLMDAPSTQEKQKNEWKHNDKSYKLPEIDQNYNLPKPPPLSAHEIKPNDKILVKNVSGFEDGVYTAGEYMEYMKRAEPPKSEDNSEFFYDKPENMVGVNRQQKPDKPREFWIVYCNDAQGKLMMIIASEEEIPQGLHVREVLPNSIQVTREQLAKAWNEIMFEDLEDLDIREAVVMKSEKCQHFKDILIRIGFNDE